MPLPKDKRGKTNIMAQNGLPANADYWSKYIPWRFVSGRVEGVVVQKDDLLQRSFAFRGPDLEASAAYYINDLSLHLSNSVKRLGSGWTVQTEVQRFSTQEYPGGTFNDLAPYLVDKERERAFRSFGRHFESSYYLTFTYRPPREIAKKAMNLFFTETGHESSLDEDIDYFVTTTDDIVGILNTKLLIEPLSNAQTCEYLHSAISMNRHSIQFPENPFFLDRLLPDEVLDIGLTMKLGENYIPVVGIIDFPQSTYPAIFDKLNKAKLEYRWCSRYICLDKEEAIKKTEKAQRDHRSNQVGWLQSFISSASKEPPKQINGGAIVKEEDAAAAQIAIDTDEVSLGLYTSNIMVWDTDLKKAKKKAQEVKKLIQSVGFVAKEETFNAFEAWKSMMPGDVTSNIRALPVISNNFSHVVPLSAIWAGMSENEHARLVTGVDLPHLICSTQDGTPFFLNLNPRDVGHTIILGPTGAGKSTFLNLLELQFFKYPESQVIVLDKGRSARQPTMACGGRYYEPGTNGVCFQPLQCLDTILDRTWATEWIESLVEIQGEQVTPGMSSAITDAIERMADIPEKMRTITTFCQSVNYIDPETKQPLLRETLRPYQLGGKYGAIFDADSTSISLDARYITLEMEYLMQMGESCVAPAISYIFHFIERLFTGRLTLLVLDEAWLFLRHPIFRAKIEEWLKTLRKKNVFVVFATQDVADAVNSSLASTLIQQCHTKIFLADPEAETPAMSNAYATFGLSEAEIDALSHAIMKQDYLYTSTLGSRLFQLDLKRGGLTLALIGTPDHDLLDRLVKEHDGETGYQYCEDILEAKGISFKQYL